MKKFLLIAVLFVVVMIVFAVYTKMKTPGVITPHLEVETGITTSTNNAIDMKTEPEKKSGSISVPIDRANERVTKKPFGIFIDPKTSPVQPEKFRGYHTGADFETFPEERDSDVSVRAVCDGTILAKRRATGYGGIVVEKCELDGKQVTVVYGHLKLGSVTVNGGDKLARGDVIGVLGAGYSEDTDGERKHLHLGIHKGSSIDIRGYVGNRQALSDWIDPCTLFCKSQ